MVSLRIGEDPVDGRVEPGKRVEPEGKLEPEEIGEPIEIPPEDSEIPTLAGVSYDPMTVSP